MSVAAELSFVRRALAEPEPPPLASGGTLGFCASGSSTDRSTPR